MNLSVRANARVAEAARGGVSPALDVAFKGGSVTGLLVVGLALLGVAGYFGILVLTDQTDKEAVDALIGLGFGGSLISVFARLGGGIFTKAADVGADLVCKIEAGIPEDDPRNPATIADNVGDNVGDVAGMGADLFESYTGSIVAAMSLAAIGIIAIGCICAIIGTFFVRTSEDADMGRLLWALRAGIFGAGALVLLATAGLIAVLGLDFNLFWAVLIGLVAGQVIGTATEYY